MASTIFGEVAMMLKCDFRGKCHIRDMGRLFEKQSAYEIEQGHATNTVDTNVFVMALQTIVNISLLGCNVQRTL